MQLNIRLNLDWPIVQAHLLQGIEQWVQLGLLTDAQVEEIAATLSQPLPTPTQAHHSSDSPVLSVPLNLQPPTPQGTQQDSPPPSTQKTAPRVVAVPAKTPSFITRLVQSFAAEISIVWFLFLGVFLIVVSSGVLAASQWQSFSAVGQYAILLIYTLGFWGASLWAYRQPHLQLTARMLTLTTLLIIPVNVWMMDTLGVMQSWPGIGIGGLATVLLTVIALKLMSRPAYQINMLGLSWLHWGWGVTAISGVSWLHWPLLATYIGTVATTHCLITQPLSTEPEQSEPTTPSGSATSQFETLTVALSLLVLLARSLGSVQIPLYQLGLAFGLCGWVLLKQHRHLERQRTWLIGGWILLGLGWGVTVGHQPPWQAIAVSGLALEHLSYQLRQHWQRWDLFKAIGIGFQAYWLLWFLLPMASRTAFLNTLSDNFSTMPIGGETWASVGLFPYVVGLLLLARQLRRWQLSRLAQHTETVSLVLGSLLTLVSLSHSFMAAINLSLSAMTLVLLFKARPKPSQALLELTHITGLVAILSWIHYVAPTLHSVAWAQVGLIIAIAEWAASLLLRQFSWQRSCWRMGLIAAGVTYLLLIDATWISITSSTQPNGPKGWWLTIPIMLTLVANHRRSPSPQGAVGFSLLALLLQTPFLTTWPLAITSFGIGTVATILNSRVWRNELVTLFAVGSGLAGLNCALGYWAIDNPDQGLWLVYGALQIGGLWVLRTGLKQFQTRPPASGLRDHQLQTQTAPSPATASARTPLTLLYRRALQAWGILLLLGLLLILTILAIAIYPLTHPTDNPRLLLHCGLAAVIILTALGYQIWRSAADWQFWTGGWALALAAAFVVAMHSPITSHLAIAFLVLGMVTQFLGDFWTIQQEKPYRNSWHGIPLVYATFGALLGHGTFSSITGYYTLTAALICIGIGRRRAYLSHFSYLGLLGLSWGAYELLVYRLLQASGGSSGDGVTLLAGLALVIALGERLLGTWMLPYLQVRSQGLRAVAHLHWGIGNLLALLAIFEGLSYPTGILLWSIIALLLAGYALLMGNHRWTPEIFNLNYETWTWLGLGEAVLAIAYARFELFPDLTFFLTWGGLFACIIGYGFYIAPWQAWGWPTRPWQLIGLWLPILTISITVTQVKTQSLLFVGAFYAWMGKQFNQVRMSYVSIVLLDWTLLRYLDQQSWLTALWFNTIVGSSILYVAEVEPYLKEATARDKRHWLRSLSCGLIGLTALYQVEVSDQWLIFAGVTLLLCLGFIIAGLMLKVRAFLYVGTLTFVIQIGRILWLFINANAWVFWAIGIGLGILFIWAAGTFEARRTHMTTVLDDWTTTLQTWD